MLGVVAGLATTIIHILVASIATLRAADVLRTPICYPQLNVKVVCLVSS